LHFEVKQAAGKTCLQTLTVPFSFTSNPPKGKFGWGMGKQLKVVDDGEIINTTFDVKHRK
jgi:hypothetical protein